MAITEAEVNAAQAEWGAGIVAIGKVFLEKGDFSARAEEHLDKLYAFGHGDVLFKPTKAAQKQFRNDRVAALSYFVAGNADFGEDGGFAINPWTAVRFENSGIILQGDTALAMGNYYFTDTSGGETKVEYSFGYLKDADGNLRINLHHSSVPYSG